ncbi:MAG: dihydroorotase [Candidatus Ranarchaeia archaeon]
MCLSKADIVVQDALCPIGQRFQRVTLEIRGSCIYKVHPPQSSPPTEKNINAKGRLLLPQITDAHVHFREPGYTHKETIETGSHAAVAGGVTTVLDMPNTRPSTTSIDLLYDKIERAKKASLVNIGFFSAYDPDYELTESLLKASCGVKIYTYEYSLPNSDILTLLKQIRKHSSRPPVAFHAEDPGRFNASVLGLSPANDTILKIWNKYRPSDSEIYQITDIIELLHTFRYPVHICHVTVPASVDLLLAARKKRLPISWEVTPHHLLLNDEINVSVATWAKVNPPLRTVQEQKGLLKALSSEKIPVIATDHAPHAESEKQAKNLFDAPSGIIGVETMLPLLLTLMHKGYLSLRYLYQLVCLTPAKIYGLPNPVIRPNTKANLTLIDTEYPWTIRSKNLHSKVRCSPFDGWKVVGRVEATIINGSIRFQDGVITSDAQTNPPTVFESYTHSCKGN